MAVKHLFVSQVEDVTDNSLVRPSDWNDDHVIEDGTNFNRAYVSKSANYTITSSDYYVEATTAGVTMTLPAAPTIGREYHVDNSSSGNVFVTGSQTINNESTQTVPPNCNMLVVYNGTKWRIK